MGCCKLTGIKKDSFSTVFFWRTRSRDRTGTSVTSLVFETSASTNSAIRASVPVFTGMQK